MSFILKMYSWILLTLAVALSTASVSQAAVMYPQPGRFVGYIHMKNSPVKIPVAFEALRVPAADGKTADLVVIMRVTFGGFDGHEYVTQNYKIANYDWSVPEIALDANDGGNGPDISLTDGLVSADGQSIKGIIHTAKGGPITGTVELVRESEKAVTDLALAKMFPEAEEIPAISGEYAGECAGRKSILQLEATRQSNMIFDTGSPFEGFDVHGRFGIENNNVYSSGGFRYMLLQSFDDAAFNFYQPAIDLPSLGRVCKVTATGLDCGNRGDLSSCFLTKLGGRRTLAELDIPLKPIAPEILSELPPMNAPEDGLQMQWPTNDETLAGSYSGYIYLEQRKAFERMSIEMSLSGSLGAHLSGVSRANLSALAKIYVGDSEVLNGQSLYFKFQPLKLPDLKPEALTFIGNTDPIMHITEWDGQTIGGIWYSRSHGFGGRFRLMRHPSGQSEVNLLPPAKVPFASSLQGSYKTTNAKGYDYEKIVLQVVRKQSSAASANYPFRLRGLYVRSRSYKEANGRTNYARQTTTISDGSFDPFTGVLSMKLSSGESIVGKMSEMGLDLHFSGDDNEFHSGIRDHYLKPYTKRSDVADLSNPF